VLVGLIRISSRIDRVFFYAAIVQTPRGRFQGVRAQARIANAFFELGRDIGLTSVNVGHGIASVSVRNVLIQQRVALIDTTVASRPTRCGV
jgi:hypothetical protein